MEIIESEKKNKTKTDTYLDIARELKILWNRKVSVIPIAFGIFGTVNKGWERGLEEVEIRGRIETIQTTEDGQNTEKCPGDQRRLAVIQIPVNEYQPTLVGKAYQE